MFQEGASSADGELGLGATEREGVRKTSRWIGNVREVVPRRRESVERGMEGSGQTRVKNGPDMNNGDIVAGWHVPK